MIGGIEPRSLEYDLGGGDDLLQCFFAAFRAGLQWVIGEGLLTFELDSAIFTTIGINWHVELSLLSCYLYTTAAL